MNVAVPRWSATDLELMRVALGFVVIKIFSSPQGLRTAGALSHPVGLARVVDLSWVGSPVPVRWMQYLAYAATVAYVAGVALPYAVSCLAVLAILDVTVRSSKGSISHGHHLVAVVLVAQAAAITMWNATDVWGVNLGQTMAQSQGATAAWWTVQVIVAVYFTSGLTKLLNTSGGWVKRSPGLLLSAYAEIETDRMSARPNQAVWRRANSMIEWLAPRPRLTRYVFAGGLFVELLAPLALLGRPAMVAVGLALISLHAANWLLLRLAFFDFQLVVLIYLINLPGLF